MDNSIADLRVVFVHLSYTYRKNYLRKRITILTLVTEEMYYGLILLGN